MAELTTTLYLRLRSDIAGKANRDRRSFERLGRSGQRSFRRIEQSARRATSAIKRHGASAKQRFMRSTTSKIAAGLGAAGLATSALNQAIRREDQKAHLAATSGKSMAKVERIWGSVTNNAIATGQSVEKVGQFLQAIQDMGGHLDLGVKHLRFFSDVMQGTGTAARDVAKMSNILVQALDVDLKKAFAILVEQGNQGSATLNEIARYAPAPLSIYKATTGRSGEQSVREVGAILQVAANAMGGVEQGSTATRALIARLTEEENLALMQRSGIETHDKDGKMRSLLDILADMAKLTEGDPTAQKRTARALNIGEGELALFLSMMGKGLKEAQSLANVKGSARTIPNQAAVIQNSTSSAIEQTKARLERINQEKGAGAALRLAHEQLEKAKARAAAKKVQDAANQANAETIRAGGEKGTQALDDLRKSPRSTLSMAEIQAGRFLEAQQRKQLQATRENTRQLVKMRRELSPFGGTGSLDAGDARKP